MDKETQEVLLVLPSIPEYVSLARMCASMMANQVGLSLDEIEELKVALSEACTNALRYGCTTHDHYEVKFKTLPQVGLQIQISDQGEGWNPGSIEHFQYDDDQIGGLGLYLIREFTDILQIESKKGIGTTITLQKNLKSSSKQ